MSFSSVSRQDDRSCTLLPLKARLIREEDSLRHLSLLSFRDQPASRFSGSLLSEMISRRWRDFSLATGIRRKLLLGKRSSLLSAFASRRFAEFPSPFREIAGNLHCHCPNLFSLRVSTSSSGKFVRGSLASRYLAPVQKTSLSSRNNSFVRTAACAQSDEK